MYCFDSAIFLAPLWVKWMTFPTGKVFILLSNFYNFSVLKISESLLHLLTILTTIYIYFLFSDNVGGIEAAAYVIRISYEARPSPPECSMLQCSKVSWVDQEYYHHELSERQKKDPLEEGRRETDICDEGTRNKEGFISQDLELNRKIQLP